MTRRVDAGAVAWVLAFAIATLAVGATVDLYVTRAPLFDLHAEAHGFGYNQRNGFPDWEVPLPVLFSAGVILWTSVVAFELSRANAAGAVYGRPGLWQLLAALFAFMAVDEFVSVHERLQMFTQTDWQLLYIPVAVAAGLLWARVLLVIIHEKAAVPWVVGAGFWLSSQLIEALRGTSFVEAEWRLFTIGEEILEMLGSSLLLVALLSLLSVLQARGVAGPTGQPIGYVSPPDAD